MACPAGSVKILAATPETPGAWSRRPVTSGSMRVSGTFDGAVTSTSRPENTFALKVAVERSIANSAKPFAAAEDVVASSVPLSRESAGSVASICAFSDPSSGISNQPAGSVIAKPLVLSVILPIPGTFVGAGAAVTAGALGGDAAG